MTVSPVDGATLDPTDLALDGWAVVYATPSTVTARGPDGERATMTRDPSALSGRRVSLHGVDHDDAVSVVGLMEREAAAWGWA